MPTLAGGSRPRKPPVISHGLILLTTVSTLIGGAAAGVTASSANAVQIQQCTGGYTFTEGYDVNNGFHPPKVEVDEYDQCTSLYTTSVTNNEGKAAFYCTG